jgi:hypothetical protein
VVHVPVDRKIEEVGDFCRACMRVICQRCAARRSCSPFLRKLERYEARMLARKSYGA